MQSPVERPNALWMRLDIGLDKIEKGSEHGIFLVACLLYTSDAADE